MSQAPCKNCAKLCFELCVHVILSSDKDHKTFTVPGQRQTAQTVQHSKRLWHHVLWIQQSIFRGQLGMYCIFTKDGTVNLCVSELSAFLHNFKTVKTVFFLNKVSVFPCWKAKQLHKCKICHHVSHQPIYTYVLFTSVFILIYIYTITAPNKLTQHPSYLTFYVSFPSSLLNYWMVQWTKAENPGSLLKSHCTLVANQPSGIPLCGSPNR